MSKTFAIIVGAGEGKRFGSPKLFSPLKGKRILDYSLEAFNNHPGIFELVLVLHETLDRDLFLDRYPKIKTIAVGGKRRQDSVFSGFQKLNAGQGDIVLVHDAARPLVKAALIDAVIDRTRSKGAAIPGLPVTDTIKKTDGDRVTQTIDRKGMVRVQTPQGFSWEILQRAFSQGLEKQGLYTDEASLVEKMGQDVFLVPGDPNNLKITVPEDLKIAEALVED